MIMTQPSGTHDHDPDTSVRLKHSDMKLPIDDENDEVPVNYVGQKKPPLPALPVSVLPDNFMAQQLTSSDRARELDFQFFNDMHTSQDCPEYNGYNTKLCHEQ